MALIGEFVEWHLTRTGWVRGTEHTGFGGTLHIDPPKGRVLSYRWTTEPGAGDRAAKRLEEQWRSPDSVLVRQLLERFGGVERAAS